MESTTQAAPKVRKLPPPPFFADGRKVAWSKVEAGTYFARCEVAGRTCTLVARLPDPRVTFKENGSGLVFDETGFDLQACAARAVARMREATGAADVAKTASVVLSKADAKAVRDCAKVAMKERTRFAFDSVCVRGGEVTATDGKRAHVAKLEAENDGERLIPKSAAAKAEAGEYGYQPAKDGAFPKLDRIYGERRETAFTFNVAEFVGAMTEAAKALGGDSPCVRLYVEADRVRVEVVQDKEAILQTSFAAKTRGGGACAFNPRYLAEAAKFVAKTGRATLAIGETKDTSARMTAAKDNGRKAFVMPVSVREV